MLGSSINPESFVLDLLGASDDPGHRVLPQNVPSGFENHVNANFGADDVNGITTIFYNFKTIYSTDLSNNSLVNAISDIQKQRAREALGCGPSNLGIQFVETSNLGITIATGSSTGLLNIGNLQIQNEAARNFAYGSTQHLPNHW